MGRQRHKPKIEIKPPKTFEPGQKVRVSPAGIQYGLFLPGTTGTVTACGFLIIVQVDGFNERAYPPDYWEAL